jgi:hypothetical protein
VSGFEAKIEEIRETGRAAGRVADLVSGVNAASAWPPGDAGMPGARAVTKLEAVRQLWKTIQTGTASDLDEHSTSTQTAADHYASNEQAANDALSLREEPHGGIRAV